VLLELPTCGDPIVVANPTPLRLQGNVVHVQVDYVCARTIREYARALLTKHAANNDVFYFTADGQYKIIEVFVRARNTPTDICEYITSLAGILFQQRESDVRFGGGSYFRGDGADVSIYAVDARFLWRKPLRCRQSGWQWIRIICKPENTRFDTFPGYEVIPARKYQID
jgi:hypothetical protein